jgi:hypothetical protein
MVALIMWLQINSFEKAEIVKMFKKHTICEFFRFLTMFLAIENILAL